MNSIDNLAPTETGYIFVGLENNCYEIKRNVHSPSLFWKSWTCLRRERSRQNQQLPWGRAGTWWELQIYYLSSGATIVICWKFWVTIIVNSESKILNSQTQIVTWSPRAWRPPCRGRSSAEASLWSSRRRSDGCHSGPDGFSWVQMGSNRCHSGPDIWVKNWLKLQ